MADKPTIVDAQSVTTTGPNVQNVPVRLNTAQMEQAIKEMAAKAMTAASVPGIQMETPSVERINPSTFMRDMTQEMERLYQRFDTLKILAAELNGRSTDEPLPPQVIFKGLTLDFAISKGDKTVDHSVKMQTLSCIGDLSTLITNEFGFIIVSLRELSKQVADLAQKTNDRCVTAFKEWETANKNKQVVTDTTTAPADNSPDISSAAPVTLQTQ